MNKADAALDRASDRLRDLSENLDERGGAAGKLADPIAEDADFLPKLKPSLIEARLKENPTGGEPSSGTHSHPKRPRSSHRIETDKKKRSGASERGGKKVVPFVGAAFAAGVVLAKIVDWRGHAHPRD
jgi:hypothetical protein